MVALAIVGFITILFILAFLVAILFFDSPFDVSESEETKLKRDIAKLNCELSATQAANKYTEDMLRNDIKLLNKKLEHVTKERDEARERLQKEYDFYEYLLSRVQGEKAYEALRGRNFLGACVITSVEDVKNDLRKQIDLLTAELERVTKERDSWSATANNFIAANIRLRNRIWELRQTIREQEG